MYSQSQRSYVLTVEFKGAALALHRYPSNTLCTPDTYSLGPIDVMSLSLLDQFKTPADAQARIDDIKLALEHNQPVFVPHGIQAATTQHSQPDDSFAMMDKKFGAPTKELLANLGVSHLSLSAFVMPLGTANILQPTTPELK